MPVSYACPALATTLLHSIIHSSPQQRRHIGPHPFTGLLSLLPDSALLSPARSRILFLKHDLTTPLSCFKTSTVSYQTTGHSPNHSGGTKSPSQLSTFIASPLHSPNLTDQLPYYTASNHFGYLPHFTLSPVPALSSLNTSTNQTLSRPDSSSSWHTKNIFLWDGIYPTRHCLKRSSFPAHPSQWFLQDSAFSTARES